MKVRNGEKSPKRIVGDIMRRFTMAKYCLSELSATLRESSQWQKIVLVIISSTLCESSQWPVFAIANFANTLAVCMGVSMRNRFLALVSSDNNVLSGSTHPLLPIDYPSHISCHPSYFFPCLFPVIYFCSINEFLHLRNIFIISI